jgi:hypothetical protein
MKWAMNAYRNAQKVLSGFQATALQFVQARKLEIIILVNVSVHLDMKNIKANVSTHLVLQAKKNSMTNAWTLVGQG